MGSCSYHARAFSTARNADGDAESCASGEGTVTLSCNVPIADTVALQCNPKYISTYADEHLVGRIGKLARKTHRRGVVQATLRRWQTLLAAKWGLINVTNTSSVDASILKKKGTHSPLNRSPVV